VLNTVFQLAEAARYVLLSRHQRLWTAVPLVRLTHPRG